MDASAPTSEMAWRTTCEPVSTAWAAASRRRARCTMVGSSPFAAPAPELVEQTAQTGADELDLAFQVGEHRG